LDVVFGAEVDFCVQSLLDFIRGERPAEETCDFRVSPESHGEGQIGGRPLEEKAWPPEGGRYVKGFGRQLRVKWDRMFLAGRGKRTSGPTHYQPSAAAPDFPAACLRHEVPGTPQCLGRSIASTKN